MSPRKNQPVLGKNQPVLEKNQPAVWAISNDNDLRYYSLLRYNFADVLVKYDQRFYEIYSPSQLCFLFFQTN